MLTLIQDVRHGMRRFAPVARLCGGMRDHAGARHRHQHGHLHAGGCGDAEVAPVKNPGELYRLGDNDNCCVSRGFQDDWSLFSYASTTSFAIRRLSSASWPLFRRMRAT